MHSPCLHTVYRGSAIAIVQFIITKINSKIKSIHICLKEQ